MKKPSILLLVACIVLPSGTPLMAQDSVPKSFETEGAATPMFTAMKKREALAAEVLAGKTEPEEVLERLRSESSPMGMSLGRQTGYAFAAVDIGQRLFAGRQVKAAELFFREAETALGASLEGLAREDDLNERLLVLRKRAHVRGRFLGKGAEAKEDLEQALRLKPGDKAIVRQRDSLLSRYGDLNRSSAPGKN